LLQAHAGWVTAGFSVYAMSLLVAGVRWRLIVGALGGTITWPDATKATVAGVFVNNVTPTGRLAGEAARIALTRLRGQLSVARGALAALCDRLSDVPGVAVLGLAALPTLAPAAGRHRGALVLGVVVAGALLLIFGRWLRASLRAWITAWRRDLRGAPVPRSTVALGLGCSAVIWAEDLLRILCVSLAFGVHLSGPQAAALCVIAVGGGFVPTIGGLGAVEGGLLGGLALFGVPWETAIAITTVERTISYGFSTVAGAAITTMMGGRSLLRAVVSGRAAADPIASSAGGGHDGAHEGAPRSPTADAGAPAAQPGTPPLFRR
jgi:uncharacterized membrane protein YbhN (UPF0104 family)